MRQILLVLSLLLLGMTWAAAQDSSQSSPSTAGQSSAGSGSDSSAMAAGSGRQSAAGAQTTVEGCLSGSNGNFTLTDKNGMSYQLTGDTAKLSEHVGHEVKVTGTSSAGGGATGGESASSTGAGAASSLQVSSVKHISKTCKSGGGMAH